jgi:hypothetical protein
VTEKFNFSKSRFFGTAGQENMIFQNVDFLAWSRTAAGSQRK